MLKLELNSSINSKFIIHGNRPYSGLKQGGYSGRVTVEVAFPYTLPHSDYFAHAELNGAWADFTDITCYVFTRSTTGIEVTIVDKASGSGTVSGSFRFIVFGTM